MTQVYRNGMILLGNLVVDEIPIISSFPEQTELVKTDEIQYSTGGAPLNVGIDLIKMGVTYPVEIIGKVGKDSLGTMILETLKDYNIGTGGIRISQNQGTSKTYVLSAPGVERRFIYYGGANDTFCMDDINWDLVKGKKIAHVGYGLLLPLFDQSNDDYGTIMGSLMSKLRQLNLITSLDFVTLEKKQWDRLKTYHRVLRYINILSIGEDQAEGLTECTDPADAAKSLVEEYGVELAVVHCGPHGYNYLYHKEGTALKQPIYLVKDDENKGSVGSGDAFTAGLLHSIHQGWDWEKGLKYATAVAAICLFHPTCTGAMKNEAEILQFMENRSTINGKTNTA